MHPESEGDQENGNTQGEEIEVVYPEDKPERKKPGPKPKSSKKAPDPPLKMPQFGVKTPSYLAWCKVFDLKQFKSIMGDYEVHESHQEEFAQEVNKYQNL